MEIKTIALNNVNIFLLTQNQNCILVDAGLDGDGPEILKAIEDLNLTVKYIIVTHAHYDHAGALSVVAKATGVPVVCHVYEQPYLQAGKTSVIKPQGTTMAQLVKTMNLSDKTVETFGATKAEYMTFKTELDLKTLGFKGYLKVLPGHTPGSICVFTPQDIICGDTVFNVTKKHFPPIYNDKEALIQTFKTLKKSGCKYIYPAHGKRIKVEHLKMDWDD